MTMDMSDESTWRLPRQQRFDFALPIGLDATGLDVHDEDTRGTDYAGVQLRRATFRCCDCRQQEFTYCALEGADFSGAWLLGVNFSGATVDEDTIFEGAIYDEDTIWPEGVDPEAQGAIKVNEQLQVYLGNERITPRMVYEQWTLKEAGASPSLKGVEASA